MRIAVSLAGALLGSFALAVGAAAREAIDEVPCDETVFADVRTFSCEDDADPLLDLDAEELAGCTIARLRVRARGGRVRIRVVTAPCEDLGRPRLRARLEGPAGCPGLGGVVAIGRERYPVSLVGVARAEELCFADDDSEDEPEDEPEDDPDEDDGFGDDADDE